MRYLTQCSFIALALAWVSPAAAGDLEFHGYMRGGQGLAAGGGPAVCYGLAGADAKFRLGNECDYVIEFIFNQHLVKNEDGSDWGIGLMPALYKPWNSDESGLDLGMNQAYVYGAGVPQLAKGTVWAGKKYYARLQTGINDQFQENLDSQGVGIEDMQLGPVKLSVAWLMQPVSWDGDANPTVKPFILETHAFIPTVEQGELKIYASLHNVSKTNNQSLGEDPPDAIAGDGAVSYHVAAYHSLNGILNGGNLVGVKLMSSTVSQTIRGFVQEGIGVPSIKTNIDLLAYYRTAKSRATPDADWSDPTNDLEVGFRTDTQISGPFRFLLEYGHSQVWTGGDAAPPNSALNKITAAFAVSSGPDPWSRPTVRLYYTHGWWNEAGAQGANQVYDFWMNGGLMRNAYGNESAGGTFGAQAEVWW